LSEAGQRGRRDALPCGVSSAVAVDRRKRDDTGTDREQLDLMRRLLDSVPAMLAYWDLDQRCRLANRAYESWFGVKPEALLGRTLADLLGPIYPLNRPYIEAALRGEPQAFEREIPNPSGGPPRHSQAYYVPDVVDGLVQGMFVLVADITPRKHLEEELRLARDQADAAATHDALTGLPNRVLLDDRLSRAIESARRRKRRCGVLFLDLDEFKRINDTLGHAAGDAVLREVARCLAGALRAEDSVARLGGDEFIILLPDVGTREQAGTFAHRVVDRVGGASLIADGRALAVGVSVGVAVFPEDGDNPHELLAHADHALYQAKRAGKNRYAFFGASVPP
jgi:diguanylate cyclase (GGDEF)-like protein/PAS domain S-box-containing protein